MVCFAMYSAANAVTKAHRAIFEPWDLTYTQYLVLLQIDDAESALSLKQLGENMKLDSGTLSPLLKRLELRGLVSKQRDADDDRKVLLSTTTKGHLVVGELIDKVFGLREAYGFGSEAEAMAFVEQLHEMTERLAGIPAGASH